MTEEQVWWYLAVDVIAFAFAAVAMHRADMRCVWFWIYLLPVVAYGHFMIRDFAALWGMNHYFLQAPYLPFTPKTILAIMVCSMSIHHLRKAKHRRLKIK